MSTGNIRCGICGRDAAQHPAGRLCTLFREPTTDRAALRRAFRLGEVFADKAMIDCRESETTDAEIDAALAADTETKP